MENKINIGDKCYLIIIDNIELKKIDIISRSYKKNSLKYLLDFYKNEYPNTIIKIFKEIRL